MSGSGCRVKRYLQVSRLTRRRGVVNLEDKGENVSVLVSCQGLLGESGEAKGEVMLIF
jgi:hypothetical protein